MDELLHYLRKTPAGKIADTAELEKLLAERWDEFDGWYGEGMQSYKLLGRMENVQWKPPELIFNLERHGGTVMGSSRADVHMWVVDIENKTAKMEKDSYRQLYPKQASLHIKPIAEELVHLITNHKIDDRLKWSKKGYVQVLTGKIMPDGSAYKSTLAGRRRRLKHAIEEKLLTFGWRRASGSWYAPPSDNV